MRLSIAFSDRSTCHVGLHGSDASRLFGGFGAARHFCRALRLERPPDENVEQDATAATAPAQTSSDANSGTAPVFVGWVGEAALARGTLEVSRPFCECLGLKEGELMRVIALPETPVAEKVMIQPGSVDDFEVVELQAQFIEEHLLAQIAVLTPRMVFPVWIHGQMPVRLRVDAADDNQGECFLLGRDTELYIESKQRAAAAKPVSVFGSSKSADADDAEQRSQGLRLRVFSLSSKLDTPVGQMNPHDLERLVGVPAPDGCLTWLAVPLPRAAERKGADAAAGAGIARLPGPQLLRVEPCADVPRQHLVVGACLAQHAHIPCFGFVRVWRCRQVPVYVPHIELVPLGPASWRRDTGDDSRWLIQLFTEVVRNSKELDVMDGAVVQLRKAGQQESCTKADSSIRSSALAFPISTPKSFSAVSDATDLYDGLSDIDDIYGPAASAQCEVISSGLGVYEVDLGLDDAEADADTLALASAPVSAATPPDGTSASHSLHHQRQVTRPSERPEAILVCVHFALGAARMEQVRGAGDVQGSGGRAPPFVRLTARLLAGEVKLTVAWPGDATPGGERAGAVPPAAGKPPPCVEPLALLWAATPGLRKFPEEAWAEVVRLVQPRGAALPLDELQLFCEPAAALRAWILAQLGCLPGEASQSEGLRATEPCVAGVGTPGAAAVLGARGTGKTTLCRRVCSELATEGVLTVEVMCGTLGQPNRKFRAVQDWLRGILRFACWHSPAVVLLDDFGALCPDVEQGAPGLSIIEERSVILAELLLDLLPELRASGGRVAIVATAPGDASVHRSLWRALAFEHKVQLRSPVMKERPEILQILCRNREHAGWNVDPALLREGGLDDWGGRVDGFSVSDLSTLVDRACIEATVEASAGLMQSEDGVRWGDRRHLHLKHLERACEGFVPATMADQSFFTSTIRWSDIGGLEGSKQALMDMLTMPTKYGVLVDRAPVKTRKGLMLVGPPGCGKTMLVQAAANELKGLLRFLTVKGPELLSKYIGASEAGVRQIFERAAAASPCVIFFDEIEALAPKRGGDSTGVTDRVVNQMLTYLDGVEDRGRVYVVAATSRPDLVDAALMRPGRFDKICYCGLPTEEEKLQICEVLGSQHGLVLGPEEQRSVNADIRAHLQQLVSKLPRLFTSADLAALFSSAKLEAVTAALRGPAAGSGASSSPAGAPAVTMAHLHSALATAKASISDADDRRHSKIFAPYRPGVRPNALHRDGLGQEGAAGTKVALA